MSKDKGLGSFQVSFLLVGTIMGAGFASGREIWTFFGVFGKYVYPGIAIVVAIYIGMCLVACRIARALDTKDFGMVVCPTDSEKFRNGIGIFVAAMLWTVMVTMTAAGGAICSQQFGLPKELGGLLVVVLVLITVFGDFDRLSKVFRKIMPFLITIMIATCVIIVLMDIPKQGYTDLPEPSPLTPTWYISAMVYTCFNIYGSVPICIIVSYNARSYKVAKKGIFIGAMFIGILALTLATVTLKDPAFSQAMDMPILAYSMVASKPINITFAITLMMAIYSSASSNFYAYTTKLPDNKYKKKIMIVTAFLGFFAGLVGFKNIVSYLFSVAGLFGVVILIMMLMNYYRVVIKKRYKA